MHQPAWERRKLPQLTSAASLLRIYTHWPNPTALDLFATRWTTVGMLWWLWHWSHRSIGLSSWTSRVPVPFFAQLWESVWSDIRAASYTLSRWWYSEGCCEGLQTQSWRGLRVESDSKQQMPLRFGSGWLPSDWGIEAIKTSCSEPAEGMVSSSKLVAEGESTRLASAAWLCTWLSCFKYCIVSGLIRLRESIAGYLILPRNDHFIVYPLLSRYYVDRLHDTTCRYLCKWTPNLDASHEPWRQLHPKFHPCNGKWSGTRKTHPLWMQCYGSKVKAQKDYPPASPLGPSGPIIWMWTTSSLGLYCPLGAT